MFMSGAVRRRGRCVVGGLGADGPGADGLGAGGGAGGLGAGGLGAGVLSSTWGRVVVMHAAAPAALWAA
jgi:hypothetical protein